MKLKYILCAAAYALASAITVNAETKGYPTVYTPGIMLSGLSDNAVYAIGSSMADDNVDNPHTSGGTIIDLRTHISKEISSPSGWVGINDVTDDGTVVGSESGHPGYWSPATESWTTFDVPAQYGGGNLLAVTPDGHYAVGYFFDANNEYFAHPMMYDLVKGENVATPNLPKHDLTGEDMHQNVFYGISPDGRYVLGQMSQSYWMPIGLFTYIYDTVEDTWRPIAYTYNEATGEFTPRLDNFFFTSTQYMSCDGAWVTGSAYMVFNGGEMTGGHEGFYPYRYNVAEDKFEVFTNTNDANISGNKITSDGVVLAASPADNPYPTAMIRRGNFFVSLDQIINQVYGMDVQDVVHDYVTGSFQALSADGLTALMCTYDNSYIITMPEPFGEAADKVDLLANYSLNIPEWAAISRISEVKVTFSRAIDCLDYPQSIRLLDSTGATVRNASGFVVSPTNDHTAVITFRSTALTPGEEYTIDIPEGMVWLKEDRSIKTAAMQIHYKGRAEGPVNVIRINPPSGSAIAEFNASPDNVTITFDTPVAINENGSCILYNADDDTMLGAFSASASGYNVTFYPLSIYHLYKGSKYRLVISEGTVTDLSGAGGNAEIVLDYHGTYVRQLSGDDLYLFKSTCDNYDDFIFWKDEFNEPNATAAAWGFAEDTPWVLVRDSEDSSDMALASHSMFTTPGESDSWLITPQIYLPDENAYLVFDAQSYRTRKEDVLKVYVCVDDAYYNYFNTELKDKFLKVGDLIFEEVIPAGATDEGLAGEWSHYTLSLEKYAGKNIYIAFVNNNYDKSAIFLDNIQVMRNMSFLVTNQTPAVTVNADKVTVSGILTLGSELIEYTGVKISLLDGEGKVIDTVDDPAAHLVYGETYNFRFTDALSPAVGTMIDYSLHIEAGNESSTFAYTLKNLTFQPEKRVVLEEFTGSSCGNCPLGILAINNLEALYPDNFIPLTLRTYGSDMYAAGATDYTDFLGLNAAPTGRINRGAILSPAYQNGSAGFQFFGNGAVDSSGEPIYLWGDAVKEELETPAEAEVTATATYDAETGDINVPCNVRFAINREDMSLGVFAVVLESQLPTYQLNYFSSYADPNLGEWGSGGLYGQQTVTSWKADDVVRYVVNDRAFNGTIMPESDFTADTDYDITLTGNVPNGRLADPANCEVVVMLIDRTTGRVINATKSAMTLGGINDIESDDDSGAEYYNVLGIKVNNPVHGQIYIRVKGGKTEKIRF